MRVLGISTGHDAGAAIIDDGQILAAVNEERLNRIKNYWGVPRFSISEVLRIAKIGPETINFVAVANITTGGGVQKDFKSGTLKKKIIDLSSYLHILDKKVIRALYLLISRFLQNDSYLTSLLTEQGVVAPLIHVEHHQAHAASAYYTSPFKEPSEALILTIDGSGDGLCSTISTINKDGLIERYHETSFNFSPAVIYSYVTHNLGFKYLSHEGKITGLAGYGNYEKTIDIFRKLITVDEKKLQFQTHLGCWGRPAARKLHLLCQGYKREDIAAGVQKRIEEVTLSLARLALKKYNKNHLAVAGGLFANVRLNQKLAELPEVKELFIHPHMGDGGVALGSAFNVWAAKSKPHPYPVRIKTAYLGSSFNEVEIRKALDRSAVNYYESEDIEKEIANCIHQGKIVARFSGQMEYGPRSLGNRSILYQATNRGVNDWLNKQLGRTEFMPFAPIVLKGKAGEYFDNFNKDDSIPAEFMTITYNTSVKCQNEAPAIVHVDLTARPQIVSAETNVSLAKVLSEYERLSGYSILVNTSFNMHEEPIVCTPDDALRAFRLGNLDILAIGDFIVRREGVKK